MSLYLKYRSQTFNDIIEQDYTKDILRQQVLKSFEGEQFSNYLFYGSRGIGKTSIARIVARALNCTNNTDGNPCNSCEQCLLIKSNRAIDIVEIDAASNTGVDNIRDEIINKAIYPPTQLRKKVYIIDEVHMLSTGAFNALLKIMEEPPSYLVFILATTELHKVPETIASRCQLFHFKRITQAGIVSRLEYICKNEGISFELPGLNLIAKLADGGMRDAVKYLDQVSILGLVDEKTVSQALGVTSDTVIKDFIDHIIQRNTPKAISLVTSLQEESIDIYVFLKDVLHYIDKNITSDTLSMLLPVVQFIKNVYEKLKYFPHPMVLLKAELLTYCQNVTSYQLPVTGKTTSPQPPAPSSQATSQAVESEESAPIEQATGNGEQETIENVKGSWIEEDFDELKERVVRNIGSQSIKSIWESACHIDAIVGNLLKVHVIEKGKLILLNMTKNKQEMEKLCSEIFDKPMQIEYEFIEKEQFLRKGLGGLVA